MILQFQELETPRLNLRRLTTEDLADLYKMRSDPLMILHTDSKLDESLEETQLYINKMNAGIDQNKWLIWAIVHKNSSKVIGTISIWNIQEQEATAELGYGIIPEFQGQGLMKEALRKIIEFGFQTTPLIALDAYTKEQNTSSIKLLEFCGFKVFGELEEQGYYSDRVYHMVIYRIENEKT